MQCLALLLIGSATMNLLSCNDNDDVNGENRADNQETRAEALLHILSPIADVDSLPDGWAADTFKVEPLLGTQQSGDNPTVRYIVVDSKEEAAQVYSNIVPKENVDESITEDSWSMDGIGSMRFSITDDDPTCTAIINFDIKQLPDLTQIKLIPESAVGDNRGEGVDNPYYHEGDVVRRISDNTYWICVRACGGSKKKSHWISFLSADDGITYVLKENYNKTFFDGLAYCDKLTYTVKGSNILLINKMYESVAEPANHLPYAVKLLFSIIGSQTDVDWSMYPANKKHEILSKVRSEWQTDDFMSYFYADKIAKVIRERKSFRIFYSVNGTSEKVVMKGFECSYDESKGTYALIIPVCSVLQTGKDISVKVTRQSEQFPLVNNSTEDSEKLRCLPTFFVRSLTGGQLSGNKTSWTHNDASPASAFPTSVIESSYVYCEEE